MKNPQVERKLYLQDDEARQATVERFFRYARHHADHLGTWSDVDTLHYAMDHFLLTLAAAVQNIQAALPRIGMHSVLNAIQRQTLSAVPEIAPIYWAWQARNHVAHDYISLVMNREAELAFAGGWACLNGAALNEGFVAMLQPIRGEDNEVLEPPNMSPKVLADTAIDFWESVYRFVLNDRRTSRFKFKELWDHYKSPLNPSHS